MFCRLESETPNVTIQYHNNASCAFGAPGAASELPASQYQIADQMWREVPSRACLALFGHHYCQDWWCADYAGLVWKLWILTVELH